MAYLGNINKQSATNVFTDSSTRVTVVRADGQVIDVNKAAYPFNPTVYVWNYTTSQWDLAPTA